MAAKGTKSSMSIRQAWEALLADNETRKGKLTDEQLRERMQKDFPDNADKATITRVGMIRGDYNRGSGMFKAQGPAGTDDRPLSNKYDAGGEVLVEAQGLDTGRTYGVKNGKLINKETGEAVETTPPKKKSASKKTSKKATGKKVSKKATSAK